jgi:hypothetical protein
MASERYWADLFQHFDQMSDEDFAKLVDSVDDDPEDCLNCEEKISFVLSNDEAGRYYMQSSYNIKQEYDEPIYLYDQEMAA